MRRLKEYREGNGRDLIYHDAQCLAREDEKSLSSVKAGTLTVRKARQAVGASPTLGRSRLTAPGETAHALHTPCERESESSKDPWSLVLRQPLAHRYIRLAC